MKDFEAMECATRYLKERGYKKSKDGHYRPRKVAGKPRKKAIIRFLRVAGEEKYRVHFEFEGEVV